MFRVIGLVLMLIIKVESFAEEALDNEGWKPLTREQVLNINRKLIKSSVMPTTISLWDPISLSEENIPFIEQNTDDEHQDITRSTELMSHIDSISFTEKPSVKENRENYNSNYLSSTEGTTINQPNVERRRQAKNIIENKIKPYGLDLGQENNNNILEFDELEKVKIKETNIINNRSNVYEVTEVSETKEMKDLLDIDQSVKNVQIKPLFQSNVKTPTDKNLSNILLNILGNYNIRINDNLTNYALSRNKLISNPHKHSYGYWTPIRSQPVRNSENDLPLDPLLAVFLSNYGFYLPGHYGFPGKYYNIYGYLASNNIHNNKPFGAYKLYSDTDSSH